MRGDAERQANIMLAVTPDSFIPDDHPIRRIKPIVDAALQQLSGLFDTMYSTSGRPSIPPEHLLKASLLIALYSIRSERQFCERLRYDLLFKWFLDLNISDEPFDASTFSKNRERLLAADVARAFFAEVVGEAKRRRLLSPTCAVPLFHQAAFRSYSWVSPPSTGRLTIGPVAGAGGPVPGSGTSSSSVWCGRAAL